MSQLTVRIDPPRSAYVVVWIILGLFMVPFGAVLIFAILRPELVSREPATLPAFGAVALLAVTTGRRLLRPIIVVLDDHAGVARFILPRLLWQPKQIARPLKTLISVETQQSGEIRHRLYGYRYPMWSLYAFFEGGVTLPLRQNIVTADAPWTEACATINSWCAQRNAALQASVSV